MLPFLHYADVSCEESVTGQRSANNRKSDFLVNQGLVARIAEAGRLRVDVVHATALIHAAGIGVTLTLAGIPPEERASINFSPYIIIY
jgi:hypothetical protein